MPAGMQIWNNGSFIQIDDTYSNYALYSKASVAASSAGPTRFFGYYVDVSVPAAAMVAFASIYAVCLERIVTSGSTKIYRYRSATANAPITVYIFLPASQMGPVGNVGFECFKADGTLSFSTGYEYMRVVQYDFAEIYESSLGTVGLPGGRTYAIVQSHPSGRYVQDSFDDTGGGWGNEHSTSMLYLSINGAAYTKSTDSTYQYTFFSTFSQPIGETSVLTMSLLVIDVTDF